MVSILLGLGAGFTSRDIARENVKARLQTFGDDSRVSINGDFVDNHKEVLSTLRGLEELPAHRSHPTKRISIEISDHNSQLVLSLGRDSSDPREYWIFYPKYLITENNEIGRIKTSLFDRY
jgi:hypothetical protein